MKKISLIIVFVLIVGGVTALIFSNENLEPGRGVEETEESRKFFDFRPSPPQSISDSEDSINQTYDTVFIEKNRADEDGEINHTLSFLETNRKMIDAYYGEWSIEERNQVLRNVLSESLHSDHLFSEDEEVYSGNISEMTYRSFHSEEDERRATVVNILDLVVDGLEQRLLVTTELELEGKWVIIGLKFELIYV